MAEQTYPKEHKEWRCPVCDHDKHEPVNIGIYGHEMLNYEVGQQCSHCSVMFTDPKKFDFNALVEFEAGEIKSVEDEIKTA